jgi:AcrR family transcriptional regulator
MPPVERRAAIVAAVVPLLAEFGDAVTCRQIAAAAGVAEGTLFRAFTDKDELLRAALDAALDPEPLEAALRRIDPSLPFERRLVEATALVQQRVVDVWRLVSNLGPDLHGRGRRPMADSAALAEIFASESGRLCVDPVDAARMLRGLTLSLTHPMIASERTPAAQIVAVILHGIARPARSAR